MTLAIPFTLFIGDKTFPKDLTTAYSAPNPAAAKGTPKPAALKADTGSVIPSSA